jgi:nucleoid-associated protein EbfC
MNPMDILKNMQDLQGKMEKMQDQLKDITVSGSSGGGMVTVKVNGKMEVLDVKIAPEVVDPSDITMLEDLVLAAVNSTLRELQDALKNQATQLTGGLNIPGGFPGLGL